MTNFRIPGTQQILIAEDEPIVAFSLAMGFEDAGFDVLGPFDRLSEALSVVGGTRVHGAVLDVCLRDGVSYPLARKLESAAVPLVMVTAASRAEIAAQGIEGPVLAKPVEPQRVVAALIDLLDGPTVAAELRASAV